MQKDILLKRSTYIMIAQLSTSSKSKKEELLQKQLAIQNQLRMAELIEDKRKNL